MIRLIDTTYGYATPKATFSFYDTVSRKFIAQSSENKIRALYTFILQNSITDFATQKECFEAGKDLKEIISNYSNKAYTKARLKGFAREIKSTFKIRELPIEIKDAFAKLTGDVYMIMHNEKDVVRSTLSTLYRDTISLDDIDNLTPTMTNSSKRI